MKRLAVGSVLMLCGACWAAGGAVGRVRVLLSPEGKVLQTFGGETRQVIFDGEGGMLYRCEATEIVAAKIGEPDKPVWKAAIANADHWRSLPHAVTEKVLAVVDGRRIVGLDKATGKQVYAYDLGKAVVEDASAPKGSLYLIDNSESRVVPGYGTWGAPATMPANPKAAKLIRVDAAGGKVMWEMTFKDDKAQPITHLDPGGVTNADWYFDEAKGVQLEKPEGPAMGREERISQARQQTNGADLTGAGEVTKGTRVFRVVSRAGQKTVVRALDMPEERVLWEYEVPTPGPDRNDVGMAATQDGVLVHVNWIRLD